MDRIDFLWWLKLFPAFEVNRIQCGRIRCVREMSLQFHWAEANAVQRNCFSMHRKYFRITKTDWKCIQSVWYCAYIQKCRIVNTMADLQWQISLLSTQNQMNPLSFVGAKHLSHTYRTLYERHSNGMPLLHRTTLPAVSLFAFVLVDKAAGIATDN